jgi:hypothetical protein
MYTYVLNYRNVPLSNHKTNLKDKILFIAWVLSGNENYEIDERENAAFCSYDVERNKINSRLLPILSFINLDQGSEMIIFKSILTTFRKAL